jgi:flagellin
MLRTNNNIQALAIGRAITRQSSESDQQVEALASGLRVKRAASDASAVSISEGFRAQVAGLIQNVRNAEQASNLLQVAQGALGVVSDVLIRMRELAVRASNGDLTDGQRQSLSLEFNQMRASVDRLSQATTYNNQILLAGFDTVVDEQSTALTQSAATGVDKIELSGALPGVYTFQDEGDAGLTLGNGQVTQTIYLGIILDGNKVADGTKIKANFDRLGIQVTLSGIGTSAPGNYVSGDLDGATIAIGEATGGDFQVGPNNVDVDRLALSLPDLRATSNSLNLESVSINSLATARQALQRIDQAIERIADERGKIGALQNRMTFTIGFSENELENMQASESTLRDADMALEASRFSRSRILAQTSQAMLAQAFEGARLSLLLL